jgi:molecular chaperone DnaK
MMRTTIDYGIDLGATSSAIARMENGTPVIIKSDVQKDTIPSCVHFNRRRDVRAGDLAKKSMKYEIEIIMKRKLLTGATTEDSIDVNFFIGFKRTMGTPRIYWSSNMNRSFSPEELSAEVLKKLKSFVQDESIQAIVVAVPARFTLQQNEATVRAAMLAGFEQVELLPEPIAAATGYGIDAGHCVVFDFGNGVFEVALVKAEKGILSVVDFDGDDCLSDKNLDEAIVDQIILPYLQKTFSIEDILNDPVKKNILRSGVKWFAEEARKQISPDTSSHTILSDIDDLPFTDKYGEEMEIDIVVTLNDLDRVLSPIFQIAIDITKELLKRNNLRGDDLNALVLAGEPTHSPVLQRMLREQITGNVDTSKDPETVVAQGAAIYASTISITNRNKTWKN